MDSARAMRGDLRRWSCRVGSSRRVESGEWNDEGCRIKVRKAKAGRRAASKG
jgi:hypothetical protein